MEIYFLTVQEPEVRDKGIVELVSSENSLLALQMVTFPLCFPWSFFYGCASLVSLSRFPILIKTPVILGQGLPIRPHLTSVTFLKALSLNPNSEVFGVRASTCEFGSVNSANSPLPVLLLNSSVPYQDTHLLGWCSHHHFYLIDELYF